jgi:aerobic carbon-monoxide dehydrogenase medium subunit
MRPAALDYRRPEGLEEAVSLLGTYGDEAKVLAGGQSLVPMLNLRLARPAVLVDIGRLAGLRFLDPGDGGGAVIGALTTHREIEFAGRALGPAGLGVLSRAARLIAHPPVRSRGTIGGSLAHADSLSEWCLLAVLLGARITTVGPGGSRQIEAEQFFQGFLTTALEPDEIVTEVSFPAPAPAAALVETAYRHGDFAIVAVGVSLGDASLGDSGMDGRPARVVVGGVAAVPVRIPEAEQILASGPADERLAIEASLAAAAAVDPHSDSSATSEYRRRLTAVLVRRAITAARDRGQAGRAA